MNILSWIVVGLIAGYLAKLIMPGRDPGGFIVTILIGIAGGLVGGFLATRVFHWGTMSGFNIYSILLATGGSLLLLFIYRQIKK